MRHIVAAVFSLAAVAQAHVLTSSSRLRSTAGEIPMIDGEPGYKFVDGRYFKNFIVVPELKLLFCTIEKAGDLSFNTLFRIIRAKYDASLLEGRPWRRNSPEAMNLTKQEVIDRIVDPSWHKAVFVREPLERYVSAFMSKCLHADEDGEIHCMKQFGDPNMKFEASVKWILDKDRQGLDDKDYDPHFMSQSKFCGDFSRVLPYFQTVEQIDRRTSHNKVVKLLSKVGIDAKQIHGFEELFPPPSVHGWEEEQHNTNANAVVQQYINTSHPWIAHTLIRHYQKDYELFNMKPSSLALAETPAHQSASPRPSAWSQTGLLDAHHMNITLPQFRLPVWPIHLDPWSALDLVRRSAGLPPAPRG